MLARRLHCTVNDTRALIGLCLIVTSQISQIRDPSNSRAFTIAHIIIVLFATNPFYYLSKVEVYHLRNKDNEFSISLPPLPLTLILNCVKDNKFKFKVLAVEIRETNLGIRRNIFHLNSPVTYLNQSQFLLSSYLSDVHYFGRL